MGGCSNIFHGLLGLVRLPLSVLLQVTSRQRSVVQNLLQNQAAADDEDLSLQPQATVAACTTPATHSNRAPWKAGEIACC